MYDNFTRDTIFIVGDSKSAQKNPITLRFNQFFLVLVVDRTNERIIDAECSATTQLTVRFIQSIFLGRRISDPGLIDEVKERYFGSSQKALIVAFCDARKKFNQLQEVALSSLPEQNPAH
ncbi:MAG: DUF3870 domain-containing protein [Sporolactobacillus sp.]